MSTLRALRGCTALAATALLAVGAAGSAHAVTVIPGDTGDGRTVIVNNAGMEVEIISVDRQAGTAKVTMSNDLGFDVFCEAATEDGANRFGGSISSAPVVEMSAEYYQRFQNVKAETLNISNGSVTMGFWPLDQLLPQGSLGEMASDAVQLRSKIIEQNTKAKVDGLFGTTPAFRLNNGASVTRDITLGAPATQPRGEDKVGYFTMCGKGTNSAAVQGTAQLYAWSAFEEGWPPPVLEGDEENGTMSSGSLGSLGSSGPAGNAGDNGTDNGDNGTDDSDGGNDGEGDGGDTGDGGEG